jgi:hypothetical protein
MGPFSWGELLLILVLLLNAIPIAKILGRVGLNKCGQSRFLFPS